MRSKLLRRIAVTLLAVTFCFSLAAGSVVYGAEAGFVGQIVQEQVQVRAGGSNNFYVVGELPKGTQVQVVEVFFGWYKIVPPQGFVSLVPTANVDVAADAKTGLVNADRTEVKAASVKGSAESFRTQTYLDKGAKVQIVGQDGAYYKIVPPAGAFVYVPPTGLRRMDPSVAVAPAPTASVPAAAPVKEVPAAVKEKAPAIPSTAPVPAAAPVAVKPASPSVTSAASQPAVSESVPSPAPAVVATPAPSVLPTKDASPAVPVTAAPVAVNVNKDDAAAADAKVVKVVEPTPLQKLSVAEGRFRQAMELPLEKQPIAELTELYQQLLAHAGFGPQEMYLIKVRLSQLDRNAKLAQAIDDSASLQARLKQEEEAAAKAAKAAGKATAPAPGQAPKYDFVGQLVASSTYDGTKMPRMFRLVEPSGFRTIAYVRPGPQLDENALLGQWVGIVGQAKYDPALKLNIIESQQIDIMEPAAAPVADQPQ